MPVIHLYGRLEDGRSFLVRESRQTPCFYIRERDVDTKLLDGLPRHADVVPDETRTLIGENAVRIDFPDINGLTACRDELHRRGVQTYQSDLRFAVSYLIQKDIRGGCVIEGTPDEGAAEVDVVFENPNLSPAEADFVPRILSFDIETDPTASKLLAISIYANGIDEVLIVDPAARQLPEAAIGFADEGSAIEAFVERVRSFDPDVFTGWNVVDFDINVLLRIAKREKVELAIGRGTDRVFTRPARGYFGSGQAMVPGRLVLDGMDLVRGAFIPFKEYSLDAVAHEVLGEGKAVEGDVRDRAGEIMEHYENDLDAFALYARTDSRLAYEIVERLNLVTLASVRSKLTGMTMDRVAASIASFDFVYLSQLNKKNLCAPAVHQTTERPSEAHHGGYVLEPVTGMHNNIWTFDYKSLYPSIIRTFNIDPLTLVRDGMTKGMIETPNSAWFKRDPAILPEFLGELFAARDAAKQRDDGVASQAIKILMNSFYGVLATPACRFHDSKLANAITSFGKHFLLWAKRWFETRGYPVLYGDTDSVFVAANVDSSSEAAELGHELIARFNKELTDYIDSKWKVPNKLLLEYEKLYERFFLPEMRRARSGARKRYAGLVHDTGEVEFTGMEVVRRDWTDLSKEVQSELYSRLFTDEPVEDYLKTYVERLRAGELDDKLVYRKGLRKPLTEYRKTTPPHVAAGRKLENPGRIISYVVTVAGPEPLELLESPPDREHYLQKQIRPVAEPVLKTLNLDFDSVVNEYHKRDLFADL